MQRAALLAAAALLAGCQTIGQDTGDAPAGAEPARPATAGAPATGGLTSVSPTAGTYRTTNAPRAAPDLPTPVPAPVTAPVAPATAPASPAVPEPEPETAQTVATLPPEQPPEPAAAALPPARPVPHIYLALQPGGAGRPVSAVFAIDAARDNTPSNDPAVRLTPENGLCNPQEMRSYDFPPDAAASTVVSETEQAQGLTAGDLPAFMAVIVTERMLSLGLASDREQTRALNVCTRKLWERLLAGN